MAKIAASGKDIINLGQKETVNAEVQISSPSSVSHRVHVDADYVWKYVNFLTLAGNNFDRLAETASFEITHQVGKGAFANIYRVCFTPAAIF